MSDSGSTNPGEVRFRFIGGRTGLRRAMTCTGVTATIYRAGTRPGSGQLAVEADAALAELVRRRLPLDQRGRRASGGRAGRVRVRVGDARAVLEQVPAGSFQVVIADLFAG